MAKFFRVFWWICIGCGAWPAVAQVRLAISEMPRYTPDTAQIYVAGTFNGWKDGDPAYRMAYDSATASWRIALPADWRAFEYRFSRGSAATLEASSDGQARHHRVFISNQESSAPLDTTVASAIAKWVDLASEITFRVIQLPSNTPDDAKIYLSGDFIGWNSNHPDYQLQRHDGYYTVTVPAGIDSFYYKFTRGTWPTVEGGYSGGFRPNRYHAKASNKPETVDVVISSWEDLSENVFSLYSFAGLLLATMGLLVVLMLVSIERLTYAYTRPLLLLISMYAVAFLVRVVADDSTVFNLQPRLYLVPEFLWFTYAPVYYFFMRRMVHRDIDPPVRYEWHWWAPAVLHLMAFLPALLQSDEKFSSAIVNQELLALLSGLGLGALIFNIYWWVVCQKLVRKASEYDTEAVPFYRLGLLQRLQWVYLLLLLCWAVTFVVGGLGYWLRWVVLPMTDMGVKLTWLLLGLPSIFITYYTLKYPELFNRKGAPMRKDKEQAEHSQLDRFQQALEQLMAREKPYLNPQLSIKDVSASIGTNTHTLSKIINEVYQKNFNDYINGYRIKAFVEEVGKGDGTRNFGDIAYDVGFNSKATFNRAFKKATGFTPREYFKK
jgi:AraC-like DNA-binding protein